MSNAINRAIKKNDRKITHTKKEHARVKEHAAQITEGRDAHKMKKEMQIQLHSKSVQIVKEMFCERCQRPLSSTSKRTWKGIFVIQACDACWHTSSLRKRLEAVEGKKIL